MHQHPGQKMMDDLQFLKDVLADSERTLMVLDPKGLILTRIWCLFEVWHSTRTGASKLSILSYDQDVDWIKVMGCPFSTLEHSQALVPSQCLLAS